MRRRVVVADVDTDTYALTMVQRYTSDDWVIDMGEIPSNPFRKIRVFISSKCGDKGRFDSMRQELAKLLEESGVFTAYLWERGGASTFTAKNNYIGELNDCDISVVVIDNADGVPPGVQNEVDHILKMDIRALFYFCNERCDEKTAVQRMLEGPDGRTFKIIGRMDRVAEQVWQDLQENVLLLFRRWCNHDVEDIVAFRADVTVTSTAELPRTAISNLPGLREVIGKFMFGGEVELEPEEGLDFEATKLAKALYLDMNVSDYNPAGIVAIAADLLPEPYAKIIEKRWGGNCRYLHGQIDDAVSLLDEALADARRDELEPWFVNDILIDLRNITSEDPSVLVVESKYQKQLTDNDGEVVYPLLDRAVSDAMERIEQDRIKQGLQGYSSYTIGENALRFIDPVCRAFAIAACFGSLTHISATSKRLMNTSFYLCTKYRNTNLNASFLKLSVICGKQGDADKAIQSFNNLRFDSDPASAMAVFNFCAKYKCMNDNGIAIFEAFGVTGCYLSDSDFAKALAVFIQHVETALTGKDPWKPEPASVFEAMRRVYSRLPTAWVLDISSRAIRSSRYFWQTEALKFVSWADVDHENVGNEVINALLEAIESLAYVTDDNVMYDRICDAVISLSEGLDGERRDRLDSIVALLPERDQAHYWNVAGSEPNDDGMVNLIGEGICHVVIDNVIQGKGGVFFGGSNQHVLTAKRIQGMNSPLIGLGKGLVTVSIATLINKTYDCTGKVHACEAICRMISLFGLDVIGDGVSIEVLESDRSQILHVHDLGKENKLLLSVWIDVLILLTGVCKHDGLYESIALCYRSDVYTQANAGDAIFFLIDDEHAAELPMSLQGFLFSYSCYLAKSLHFQLNLRGLKLLSAFLPYESFRSAAAHALFDGYMGQSPRGKQIIIRSIPAIREFDEELADDLREMVVRDNTTTAVDYLRRMEAKQG